jgi:hypothetical protein
MFLRIIVFVFCSLYATFSLAYTSLDELVEKTVGYYLNHTAKDTAEFWSLDQIDPLAIRNALERYEKLYGKVISYDVIATEKITPHVALVFLAANYQKGATFLRFQTYLTPEGKWRLMFVTINSEPFGLIPTIITFEDRIESYYEE